MNTLQTLLDRTGHYLFYVEGSTLWCYRLRTSELPVIKPENSDSFMVYNQPMKGFCAFVHGPAFYCLIQTPSEDYITMRSITSGKAWELASSSARR